jgi:acyl-CoA thioester hydrolase
MYRARIYYKDTDAGGVVYYANYLRFFEAARTDFLLEHGFDLRKWARQGILFVVTRAEVDYLSPARYGDVLIVDTQCTSVSGVRFELVNHAVREEDRERIAVGKTTLACLSDQGKPCRIPKEIHEVLNKSVKKIGS